MHNLGKSGGSRKAVPRLQQTGQEPVTQGQEAKKGQDREEGLSGGRCCPDSGGTPASQDSGICTTVRRLQLPRPAPEGQSRGDKMKIRKGWDPGPRQRDAPAPGCTCL